MGWEPNGSAIREGDMIDPPQKIKRFWRKMNPDQTKGTMEVDIHRSAMRDSYNRGRQK